MLVTLALVTAVVAAVRGVWSPCGLSMLSSLNPVSERARGHRFAVTAAWYLAGGLAGGALLGAGLAVAALGVGRAHPSGTVVWSAVVACGAIAFASDARVFGRSLPVHPRQVDDRWLSTYRRWIYAGGYGVQIGAGFATYIMSAAVYLTAALAVLTASPGTALAVAVVFGGVRGAMILCCTRATTPNRLRALMARIDALAPASIWTTIALAAAVTVVGVTVLGGPAAAAVCTVALAVAALMPRVRGRMRTA